jgi:glutamine synthetase
LNEVDWRAHIQEMIRQRQVQMVRVCVQDAGNIARCRYITARHLLEQFDNGELSIPSALFSMDSSAVIQPGLGTGMEQGFPSWRLRIDPSTFNVLSYAPGVARLIADVYDEHNQPVPYAPRHVLRQVLRRLDELGLRVRGSFEFEFYVFRQTEQGLVPVWNGLQCFSESKQAEVEDIIQDVMQHLGDMGAGPEIANTEYGSGQFEVSNSPFWGLEIADMAFYYRSSIKEVLAKKGYVTSFMSKPVTGMSGSGAHLHHSLYDAEGRNVFWDPEAADGLSDVCRWFIGGQLHHANTLTVLTTPTINGYKRLQPYSFAPCTVTWGYEHRGALIRVPHSRGQNTRLENRLPGADTDPYLSLAAVLAAGLDGIDRQLEPGEPVTGQDPYGPQWARLPKTPEEGLRWLDQDEWARQALGDACIDYILKLRSLEYERFLRHVTDWEIQTYQSLF